jgi:hypothetical protein
LIGGATVLVLICCGATVTVFTSKGAKRSPTNAAPASPTPSSSSAAEAPTAAASPTTTPSTTGAAPPPLAKGFGDGTWLVPADIKPGTFQTTVPDDSIGCYWQRAKNAEGDVDSILANDNVSPGGHVIVTITKSDKAFKAEGCGDWFPAPRSGPKSNTINEGTWAVGVDIAPGTYSTTVPNDSNGCYWERTKNLTGDSDSIIANDNVNPGARATVTIKSADKAFKASGCGTWKRR